MVQMGVRQQQDVDGGRLEPEGLGVILVQFVTALEHAAVDQDALAGALDKVARARHALGSAVERDLHHDASRPPVDCSTPASVNRRPASAYQRWMSSQISCAVSANQNRSRSSGSITPSSTRNSGSKTRRQ